VIAQSGKEPGRNLDLTRRFRLSPKNAHDSGAVQLDIAHLQRRDFGCAETSFDRQTDQRSISLSNSGLESINSSEHSLNFGICETFPMELILVNPAQTPIGFLRYATSLHEQPAAQYESMHAVVTY